MAPPTECTAVRDGNRIIRVFTARLMHIALLGWLFASMPASGAPSLADVHVHYKWSQKEVTAAQQAIGILRDNDIALAVVIGTPAEYALELARLAPQTIVPIWSPYREPADWSRWPHDRKVLERARDALLADEQGSGPAEAAASEPFERVPLPPRPRSREQRRTADSAAPVPRGWIVVSFYVHFD